MARLVTLKNTPLSDETYRKSDDDFLAFCKRAGFNQPEKELLKAKRKMEKKLGVSKDEPAPKKKTASKKATKKE